MRLFVSYARVDKPYCLQIIDMLDVHEVWYDERLFAGQQWWKEILRRLDWCQAFIYLLSPVSIASEYCRKEYSVVRESGKPVIPVLIDDQTPIPSDLQQLQYVDFSKGITPEAVKTLLNALHRVERDGPTTQTIAIKDLKDDIAKPPALNPATVVSEAAYALETGDYDGAVFLLKQAIEKGIKPRFIDLNALLAEAEVALDRKAYTTGAAREYKQIAVLVKHKRTFKLGLEAFRAFREQYPDHDPENLRQYCDDQSFLEDTQTMRAVAAAEFTLPMLEWCEISTGMVTVETGVKNGTGAWRTFYVDGFRISKYPITNKQYQAFIQDAQGYTNSDWWNFSKHAREWRMKNPQPKPPRFKGDERPRENVTWYEAMAFCNWLSTKTGSNIILPTEQQWQRAAQGDDNFLYPWGNLFEMKRCNTRESKIRMTTAVTRYEEGVSTFGVFDMAGNVWEWCLTGEDGVTDQPDITSNVQRAVHGGSFIGESHRAQATFRFLLQPVYYYATIGFRVVQLLTST